MNTNRFPDSPILLIDDEPIVLETLTAVLKANGIDNVRTCVDSRKVNDYLISDNYAMVMLDLTMPHIKGEEILNYVRQNYPELPVIVVTGISDINTAVACMRKGAFDYILKPISEEKIIAAIKRVFDFKDLEQENVLLTQMVLSGEIKNPEAFAEIITQNTKMFSIFRYIDVVSKTKQPVMITGETGTGKELIAKSVHLSSGRKGNFVAVNVAGLDDQMFSDTLFGHVKGAFTEAVDKRAGLIEKAAGGTLFLDEIGDLSVASQVKLLRLLQRGEYFPLGSDEMVISDTRIVAATNRSMEALRSARDFRDDLWFRLSTHHVEIPPLRDRIDDLAVLMEFFINKGCEELGKDKMYVENNVIVMLSSYAFPGNIRELEGMVFNAVTHSKRKKMTVSDFSFPGKEEGLLLESSVGGDVFSRKDISSIFKDEYALPTLDEMEELMIVTALEKCGGNQAAAARILGLSRQALNKRLKRKNYQLKA